MTCMPTSGSRRSCAATAAKSRSSFSRRRSSETSNATLIRPDPNGSTVCTQTPRTWIASRHIVSSVISADSAGRRLGDANQAVVQPHRHDPRHHLAQPRADLVTEADAHHPLAARVRVADLEVDQRARRVVTGQTTPIASGSASNTAATSGAAAPAALEALVPDRHRPTLVRRRPSGARYVRRERGRGACGSLRRWTLGRCWRCSTSRSADIRRRRPASASSATKPSSGWWPARVGGAR
jgi:hypothetical protein